MDDNKYIDIIESFYKAFQERDAERMASYYHEDITFNDPAFKHLKAEHAGNMWRMLLSQADKNMKIRFSDVWANDTEGGANWRQSTFSQKPAD